MSGKIKIVIETNVAEATKMLQAILQVEQVKKELKFPCDCWNCGVRIAKKEDLVDDCCSVCGLIQPEP